MILLPQLVDETKLEAEALLGTFPDARPGKESLETLITTAQLTTTVSATLLLLPLFIFDFARMLSLCLPFRFLFSLGCNLFLLVLNASEACTVVDSNVCHLIPVCGVMLLVTKGDDGLYNGRAWTWLGLERHSKG